MLAFDIETTGLISTQHDITVICTEDLHTGERKAYEFARHRAAAVDNGLEWSNIERELIAELVQQFDAATSLCAFNGVRFDLPFMQTALKLDEKTVLRWVLKTTDILEQSRHHFKTTFSLNLLCDKNQLPLKSSDGMHAIVMAKNRDFDGLRDYCADDVHILCNLYRKRYIELPKTRHIQDLSNWSLPGMYDVRHVATNNDNTQSFVQNEDTHDGALTPALSKYSLDSLREQLALIVSKIHSKLQRNKPSGDDVGFLKELHDQLSDAIDRV